MSDTNEFFKENECLIVEFQYNRAFIYCDICKKKIKEEITFNVFKKDEDGKIDFYQTLCKKCKEDIYYKSVLSIDYELAGHDVCKMIRDREMLSP